MLTYKPHPIAMQNIFLYLQNIHFIKFQMVIWVRAKKVGIYILMGWLGSSNEVKTLLGYQRYI